MTAVEPALVALLVNDPGTIAVVANRLYPNVAPEGACFPHAVYYRVSTGRRRGYKGTVATIPSVQFDCYALDYPSAKAAALAIGQCLEGFVGNVPGGLLRVQGTWVDEESDDYERPEHADEAGVHKCSLTVRVWFSGT